MHHVHIDICIGLEEVVGFPGTGVAGTQNHLTWVLETKPGFFARALSTEPFRNGTYRFMNNCIPKIKCALKLLEIISCQLKGIIKIKTQLI